MTCNIGNTRDRPEQELIGAKRVQCGVRMVALLSTDNVTGGIDNSGATTKLCGRLYST